jgi:ABC-type bacteriocin/lantibiotic exporter with double-glycine peptidase domain
MFIKKIEHPKEEFLIITVIILLLYMDGLMNIFVLSVHIYFILCLIFTKVRRTKTTNQRSIIFAAHTSMQESYIFSNI